MSSFRNLLLLRLTVGLQRRYDSRFLSHFEGAEHTLLFVRHALLLDTLRLAMLRYVTFIISASCHLVSEVLPSDKTCMLNAVKDGSKVFGVSWNVRVIRKPRATAHTTHMVEQCKHVTSQAIALKCGHRHDVCNTSRA